MIFAVFLAQARDQARAMVISTCLRSVSRALYDQGCRQVWCGLETTLACTIRTLGASMNMLKVRAGRATESGS